MKNEVNFLIGPEAIAAVEEHEKSYLIVLYANSHDNKPNVQSIPIYIWNNQKVFQKVITQVIFSGEPSVEGLLSDYLIDNNSILSTITKDQITEAIEINKAAYEKLQKQNLSLPEMKKAMSSLFDFFLRGNLETKTNE